MSQINGKSDFLSQKETIAKIALGTIVIPIALASIPILFSYQNLEQSRLGSLMQVDFSTRVYLPKLAINLASAFI